MIVTFTHRGLLEKAFCLTARGLRDIGDARLTKATVGVSVVIIIRLTLPRGNGFGIGFGRGCGFGVTGFAHKLLDFHEFNLGGRLKRCGSLIFRFIHCCENQFGFR
jgi:hypothetical protein